MLPARANNRGTKNNHHNGGKSVLTNQRVKGIQTKAISELEKNSVFQCLKLGNGPFGIFLQKQNRKLVIDVKKLDEQTSHTIVISLSPYKRAVQDYFVLIESYEQMQSGSGSSYNSLVTSKKL